MVALIHHHQVKLVPAEVVLQLLDCQLLDVGNHDIHTPLRRLQYRADKVTPEVTRPKLLDDDRRQRAGDL